VLELIAEVERLRAIVGTHARDVETAITDAMKTGTGMYTVSIERRRDLAHAKLPLDAEVALEHAALALSRSGQPQAHQQVIQVLAAHLPPLDGEDTEGGSHD
jgi:hypothetical protein